MEDRNFDAWMSLSYDRTQAHLRKVELHNLTQSNRRMAQRRWLSRQAGRALRGIGTQLLAVGRRLECGSEPAVFLPREPKAA